MRTIQTNTTEKTTKTFKISVLDIKPLFQAIAVLTLTTSKRKGGET